jgi:hypothetical protein
VSLSLCVLRRFCCSRCLGIRFLLSLSLYSLSVSQSLLTCTIAHKTTHSPGESGSEGHFSAQAVIAEEFAERTGRSGPRHVMLVAEKEVRESVCDKERHRSSSLYASRMCLCLLHDGGELHVTFTFVGPPRSYSCQPSGNSLTMKFRYDREAENRDTAKPVV